jgi:hypothetical protein
LDCSQTVKETVKDFVPVDTSSAAHKLLILLMFRSVMVHTRRNQLYAGSTIYFSFFDFLSLNFFDRKEAVLPGYLNYQRLP